jgi:CcmD family protein
MESRELQFVFYGFTAAWVIMLAYVLTIVMRERRLKRELDRVRRMVEDPAKR